MTLIRPVTQLEKEKEFLSAIVEFSKKKILSPEADILWKISWLIVLFVKYNILNLFYFSVLLTTNPRKLEKDIEQSDNDKY